MRSAARSTLPWALALLLAGPAAAADTTTFNVTLIVTKACTITAAAATNVDFGTAASTTATTPGPSSVDPSSTTITGNPALHAPSITSTTVLAWL